MGTSTSATQLARKFDAAALALRERSPQEIVRRITVKAKQNAEAERNRAVGGDGRMSHVGRAKGGTKLGVRYDYDKTNTATPQSLLRATGPWQLIENNTAAHVITSRYGGGSRRSRTARAEFVGPQFTGRGRNRKLKSRTGGDRRAVLNTPFGYRRSALHPGTRGKHPWQKATLKTKRDARREVSPPVRDALVAVFR